MRLLHPAPGLERSNLYIIIIWTTKPEDTDMGNEGGIGVGGLRGEDKTDWDLTNRLPMTVNCLTSLGPLPLLLLIAEQVRGVGSMCR